MFISRHTLLFLFSDRTLNMNLHSLGRLQFFAFSRNSSTCQHPPPPGVDRECHAQGQQFRHELGPYQFYLIYCPVSAASKPSCLCRMVSKQDETRKWFQVSFHGAFYVLSPAALQHFRRTLPISKMTAPPTAAAAAKIAITDKSFFIMLPPILSLSSYVNFSKKKASNFQNFYPHFTQTSPLLLFILF